MLNHSFNLEKFILASGKIGILTAFIATSFGFLTTVNSQESEWTGAEPIVTWNSPVQNFDSESSLVDINFDVQLNNSTYLNQDIEVSLVSRGMIGQNQDMPWVKFYTGQTVQFTTESQTINFNFEDVRLQFLDENSFGVDISVRNFDGNSLPGDDPTFTLNQEDSLNINNVNSKVYRFYSEVYGGHFYTTSVSERDNVIANDPNWNYEGEAFSVTKSNPDGSCVDPLAVPVHRFWSDVYTRHFYTTNESEANQVMDNSEWNLYNGIVFCAYDSAYIADVSENDTAFSGVYRFWNVTSGGHFYTNSISERDDVIDNNPNWTYEMVAFAAKGTP